MPATFRTVAIAPGKSARVRRLRSPATRAGHVTVKRTHGEPFEVPVTSWDQGSPA